MKINVVGTSGSGKSTVARQLAEKFALPHIELDKLFWRPQWQGTPDDEFLAQVLTAITAGPKRLNGKALIGWYG